MDDFRPQIRLFSCRLQILALPGTTSLASPERAANSPDILGLPLMTWDSPGFFSPLAEAKNGFPEIVLDLISG